MRYPGMEQRLQGLGIDIALLPINGLAPDRRVAGNLNGAETADLALSIGAQIAISCLYEMFELDTASPTEFEEQMSDPGSAKCSMYTTTTATAARHGTWRTRSNACPPPQQQLEFAT